MVETDAGDGKRKPEPAVRFQVTVDLTRAISLVVRYIIYVLFFVG